MYTEVAYPGDLDLRHNPLAMSLHPIRIGPNYVIRSDERNTCTFFPDSFNVGYSSNEASTETTYRTLRAHPPSPTQNLRTYKRQTYEKRYRNGRNASLSDLKPREFCSVYSCTFCHPENDQRLCSIYSCPYCHPKSGRRRY